MTLKEFIQSLQNFADKNPETLDLDVILLKDSDRNSFDCGVLYEIEVVHVKYDEKVRDFKRLRYDEKDKASAVYLNLNC